MAVGPALSGRLVGALGWRATFGLYAALVVVALAGVGYVAESRAEQRPRLNVTGAVVFVAGLGALVLGVVQGPEWGWASAGTLSPLVAGVGLLVVFVVLQARASAPLLDLSLVKNRRFLALCMVPVVAAFGFVTLLTYLPTYLVGASGFSPQRAGTVLLLMTAPVLLAPPLAGGLVNRGMPTRVLITISLALLAGGNAWLTVIGPDTSAAVIAGPRCTERPPCAPQARWPSPRHWPGHTTTSPQPPTPAPSPCLPRSPLTKHRDTAPHRRACATPARVRYVQDGRPARLLAWASWHRRSISSAWS